MRDIGLEEAKQIELDVLKSVVEFCEQRNLRYYLAYGTLIGAVRHKGFIPWDDDVDIQMPRKDYDEFIKTFDHEYLKVIAPGTAMSKHPIVKVIDTRTVKIEPVFNYPNGYLGIDIDIFPLEGTPTDEAEFAEWYAALMKNYKDLSFSTQRITGTFEQKIKKLIRRFLAHSPKRCLKDIERLHAQSSYEDSEFVGSIACLYNSAKNRVPKSCFENTVDVEFEGIKFKAPAEYDYVLRSIYGDYMQLPPEEKRVTHHTNKMYWKE